MLIPLTSLSHQGRLNRKNIKLNIGNALLILIFNEIIFTIIMTLNHVKLGCTVAFMQYLASIVSLIFVPQILIQNKITFLLPNSLKLAELVIN